MTKDNSTGKNKEFYDLGKKMFDRIPEYERGFVDGMQKQMQSSVDKAVNRMAQPEQEPVAWFHLHNCEAYFTTEPSEDMLGNYWTPLFTSPPQRTWVGLSFGEARKLIDSFDGDAKNLVYDTEAKLQEKNT